jgi:polysaccharide export outer membrane protein
MAGAVEQLKRMANLPRLLLVPLIAAVCLAGCTSTLTPTNQGSASAVASDVSAQQADLQMVASLPPPTNTGNGADDLIAPNDLLSITVFQISDLSKDVQVDSTGHTTLPLIGVVQAAGKSIDQFQADITRLYGSKISAVARYLVSMKVSAGQRVTLESAHLGQLHIGYDQIDGVVVVEHLNGGFSRGCGDASKSV